MALVALLSPYIERISTPITIKMQSIPFHIYWSEKRKRSKFNSIIFLLSNGYAINAPNPVAKLRIRPPAITEAICPETLTPIDCIRRKF